MQVPHNVKSISRTLSTTSSSTLLMSRQDCPSHYNEDYDLNLIFILGSCVWFLCWSTSRKWSTLSVLQVCCNLFCIYGFLGSKVKKCTCGFRSGDYLTYFLGKGCYVVLAPIPFFTPLDLFLIPLEITFNIDQSSLIEIPSWLSPPSSFKLNQVE